MTFAQGFYDFFKGCPLIEGQKLNFDRHSVNPGEYYLETSSPDTLIKRYMHGRAIWQKPVYFCMVGSIGQDQRIQIANKIKFEVFRDWVEQKNAAQQWPTLPPDCHPVSLECTTDGYIFSDETNVALYQIQMLLTYQKNM